MCRHWTTGSEKKLIFIKEIIFFLIAIFSVMNIWEAQHDSRRYLFELGVLQFKRNPLSLFRGQLSEDVLLEASDHHGVGEAALQLLKVTRSSTERT